MTDDERLRVLAAAVADGVPIDWRQAEFTAPADERDLVRQFKLLATLAEVHRQDEGTRTVGSPGDVTWPEDPQALDRWGPLQLRELVGRGGYGTVYRAWDPQLAREVALKLLSVENADDNTFEQSVIAEGRLLARIRHQNVIAVYGADAHDGRVGFWMEFLEGQTLKQWVDGHGRMNSREAALIGIDVCRALAAVHGVGLVHRDVKAQNVMREAGGRTVLMDFGTGAESGRAARLAGTPLYMAPELFEGAAATPRSDIYGLGVLLFYLVSGAFPVAGVTLSDIKQAHASGLRQNLRDVRPDLPAAFVRVVDRALSPDPARRPATAGAFEAELTASLELLPDTPPVIEPRARHGIRNGVMAATALAVVLTTLWTSGVWTNVARHFGGPRVRSLAVLPLVNLSGQDQDYFSAGMTDLLTTNLSKLKALRVISRSSVKEYQDAHRPIRDIAAALDVDAVLQGSIVRDGNRLRVTAQLISAADQSSLWADSYERDAKDAFKLQGDLARDIARGINLSLSPQEQLHLTSSGGSSNAAAQEEYLKGWTAIEPKTSAGAAEAIQHFENAIRLDPNYAQAYSAIADAYLISAVAGKMPVADAYTKARQAALQALELDSSQAAAHYSLAEVQFNYDWDWAAAAASFREALDLDPNSADAHEEYGWFLLARGQLDEALNEVQRARLLDPLLHTRHQAVSGVLFYMRRYDEAAAELQQILATSKNPGSAKFALGRVYAASGRTDAALALFSEAGTPHDLRVRAEVARVYVQAGRIDEARELLTTLEADPEALTAPDALAFVYAALGDKNRAFDLLNKAIDDHLPSAVWLKIDPRFDSLRGDSRYPALLKRIGLQ